MGLFSKIFGTYSEREIKKLNSTVDRIEALADEYSALSESELRGKTAVFRERLAAGETLDDLLPEAFATVREAGRRVLSMYHFRVQLLGGIVLHQGRIAEMKTGEGKTLAATLPVYLNALTGKGVHVVTVNDYLASRDSEWMGKFIAIWVFQSDSLCMAYRTRSAESTLPFNMQTLMNIFDYLRDNMVVVFRIVSNAA